MKAIDFYHCKKCNILAFTRCDDKSFYRTIYYYEKDKHWSSCKERSSFYQIEREATHKEKLFFANNDI